MTGSGAPDRLRLPRRLGAPDPVEPRPEAWETTDLHTVSTLLAAAAARRAETRGSHWREDRAERDDARWRGHLLATLGADGALAHTYQAVP